MGPYDPSEFFGINVKAFGRGKREPLGDCLGKLGTNAVVVGIAHAVGAMFFRRLHGRGFADVMKERPKIHKRRRFIATEQFFEAVVANARE